MKSKLLSILTIIGYVFLVIIINDCYAVQNNLPTNSASNPPPSPNTAAPSSFSANTTITPSSQDITMANKLFEGAGYQHFQINQEVDLDKNHPEFFTIPGNTDDDNVDITN